MKPVVDVENLSYSYPDGTTALRDVSFQVAEEEALAIVGPNGAGKSTVLLHLNGIIMNTNSVRILGLTMNQKNLRTIRSKVGLVFQDPDNQLFMPTVFEDVAFGPLNMGLAADEVKRRVTQALAQVDLGGFGDRLSHHLSFGEKKRVSIATVLSMEPAVLVLDEPTSNLDPRHRRDLIRLLNRLKRAMIIATHDVDLVLDTCRRVIVLDRGAVVAEGKTVDILGNQELLAEHGLEAPYRCRPGFKQSP